MKKDYIKKTIASVIIGTILMGNLTGVKVSASENIINNEIDGAVDYSEVSTKSTLIIPSMMIVYNDEEVSTSVIRQIEEINNTIITNSSMSISQIGNRASVTVSVSDYKGSTGYGTISVTIVKRPAKPVISTNDLILMVGDYFDPLSGVTAIDEEDGDITNKIVIISNNVNVNNIGSYDVLYQVTDSDGLIGTNTRNIKVKENSAPIISVEDKTIYFGSEFNPLSEVTAIDEEDGTITNKIKIITNTVNTKKVGTYKVIYNVDDSRGKVTSKEIKVNVAIDNLADWKDNWATKEIQNAMEKGWVETTNKFRPEDAITRAEFVKIVNKSFGFTSKATSEGYTDVKSGDWWYNEVLIAVKAGYIDIKASNFRPQDKITREEVASIITSIKKNKDSNLDKLSKYKDSNKVSVWAKSSVEGAIEQGYMGKNSDIFRAKDNITRAEAIVTLSRI